jgi:hypothetical protein
MTDRDVIDAVNNAIPFKPPAQEPRFTIFDAPDFLGRKYPPRDNLLAPWLPVQGLAMIYAKRGIGKTFLALSIAHAVATGGKILNWHAPTHKRVLYCDGEMPASVMQERLAQIVSASGRPIAGDHLRIMTVDDQRHGVIDLSNPDHQAFLEPQIQDVDLIIADNISTLCRQGRENEGESWLPVQDWALRQRAAGRSVLFLHHAGKAGEQRGTSKREDVLDTVINLRVAGDYDPEQGAEFEVHFQKARGIYGGDTKPFIATYRDGQWLMADLEQSTLDRCVELYREGLTSPTDIAEQLGINKSTASRHIAKAKREGVISAN